MKILVPVKRVIDPNVKVRLRADHSGADLDNAKMALNPFCEIALEQAVRLKESGIASEVVAVSIGPSSAQEQLRQALAVGADSALLIETDRAVDSLAVARLLHWVVKNEAPDLILLGKQAVDSDNHQTGPMLAALARLPQATCVSEVEVSTGSITVQREIDGGLQCLRLPLPAVLTADLRLNEPRYARLPDIMKAKKKPLTVFPAEDTGIDLLPGFKTLSVTAPAERQAGIRVNDVHELLHKLKHEAKVIS